MIHTLHYAAKKENLKIFKIKEEVFKSPDPLKVLCAETFHQETLLHICCIHKMFKFADIFTKI